MLSVDVNYIRDEQCLRRHEYYVCLSAADRNDPSVIEARRKYDETVERLSNLLGVDAPCWDVDIDLWLEFRDFFRDSVGCRPVGVWTVAQVNTWIERQESTPWPVEESR